MQLTMAEVAAALGASSSWTSRTPAGSVPENTVRAYSIDSRSISPGALFFALRGPRFDGHDFVLQAFDRGAVGAVVENGFAERTPSVSASRLIVVPDTAAALRRLGQEVRQRWGREVIAVTGSTGKTTTRELIAAALAPRLNVHKSPGNLNNDYGLPLALLALEPRHDVAVLELAMSAPGEIGRLARLADPGIGVVTNVAPVHLEFFDSIESIASAKQELIANLKDPAVAVLNYDDARVRRFGDTFSGRVVTYGLEEGADFRALRVRHSLVDPPGTASEFEVTGPGFAQEFILRLPGIHNVQNALAAIATARLFEVPLDEMRSALAAFDGLHQRGEILSLGTGITIINDCYNSNPLAMRRMLETLAGWPAARRRIVVAGEMLELGVASPELHRQVGRDCVESHVDWLIGIQGDAAYFLEGALRAGMPAARTRFFAEAEAAGEFCRNLLLAGDVVLVKGSRGVHLERVTELLQTADRSVAEPGVVNQGAT